MPLKVEVFHSRHAQTKDTLILRTLTYSTAPEMQNAGSYGHLKFARLVNIIMRTPHEIIERSQNEKNV